MSTQEELTALAVKKEDIQDTLIDVLGDYGEMFKDLISMQAATSLEDLKKEVEEFVGNWLDEEERGEEHSMENVWG
jgi:hypothetical protein